MPLTSGRELQSPPQNLRDFKELLKVILIANITPKEGITSMLIDGYNRVIDTLRILVTSRCNLNCFFCHREGSPSSGEELLPEDISFIVSEARALGITRIRLTGGEPLLRNDIVEIVRQISKTSNDIEISMTTNGTLLDKYAEDLRKAGMKKVNISIHSLNPDTYRKIVGKNLLEAALKGLKAAYNAKLQIKINFVVLRGINEQELSRLIELARSMKARLQIIELEPIQGLHDTYTKYHVNPKRVLNNLKSRARAIYRRKVQNRPVIMLDNGVEIEVVEPLSDIGFCLGCNRLRLTPDGVLKACLFSFRESINLVPYVRKRDKRSLRKAFVKVISHRRPFFIPQGD